MSWQELMQLGGVVVMIGALIAGMDWAWRPRPMRQIFRRFPGNDYAKTDYEARLEAAGGAPVRNIRDVAATRTTGDWS